MGWTSYHANIFKNGKIDRKREVECNILHLSKRPDLEVIKSTMVGNNYFAAVKSIHTGKTSALIVLTKVSGRQIMYKILGENDGPAISNCPKGILNILSETENEAAKEWRRKCLETANSLKLSDIPIGAKIKAYLGPHSSAYLLTKMAPSYQFKSAWYMTPSGKYIPKSHITRFEIAEE